MNSSLLQQLINWPNRFISRTDLNTLLIGSEDSKKAIIKRAVNQAYLERLKQNFYLINKSTNKAVINNFELAQFLYGPSYISFESALSYHGWIPEKVVTTCSATLKRSRLFRTSIGEFSFDKVPSGVFSCGTYFVKENKSCYLLADPWKAIADIMYSRKKYWPSLAELIQDLRIEEESIKNHRLDLLEELSKEYPHQLTRNTLRTFLKDLKAWQ